MNLFLTTAHPGMLWPLDWLEGGITLRTGHCQERYACIGTRVRPEDHQTAGESRYIDVVSIRVCTDK